LNGECDNGFPEGRDILGVSQSVAEVSSQPLPRHSNVRTGLGGGEGGEGAVGGLGGEVALLGLLGLQVVAEGHELIDFRHDALLLGEGWQWDTE
jgi:hypothetical protein